MLSPNMTTPLDEQTARMVASVEMEWLRPVQSPSEPDP
jgi:hypothetical protein